MYDSLSFTAIDFETATSKHDSACAVGIVMVENGQIINEYYSLIKPPKNEYMWQTTRVHGLKSADTMHSPTFDQIFPEIQHLLQNRIIVAHNELFDRNVLRKTMEFYGLEYNKLHLAASWECTFRIYQKMGFKPARLNSCCEVMGIELNHHEALSDARACAQLYLLKDKINAVNKI